ncbi:MAG: PAS domain S-box protein [Vicinamibacteraceae bacterium]
MPARDDVRESALVDADSAAARVHEFELQVHRLAQANRQLAEREARLRAIFDAGPDAVALVGRDGTILDLNPAGRQLIELDASSRMIGLRLDTLATDPHRAACRSLATRVFRGESATVDLEIQGLRGRRCWIETHATPLRGEDGAVTALVCTSRDITVRRAAEVALRDREARWRGVFGSPMVGIMFWDRSGAITDANDSLLQLIGYTREDLEAGRISWLDMTPAEERHLDTSALERVAATGVCDPYEKHYIRKDGSRVPIVIGAAMIAGSNELGVAYVQDITARRHAEVQLRESEARFRNMAENAPLILWVADGQGECTYVNQNWFQFSGQAPEQALGHGLFTALHPDDAVESERLFRDAAARHIPWHHECRVRRRDGIYRHMSNTASPRFGPSGEFLGYVGLLMDIQDRKDAEVARLRLEAPLRQAQKMEALGTLAGGVAHDFNNILGTIIGNVELAREDLVAEHPAQESLAEVEKASARARELVQQILTFGRRQPDERRVIGLREVIEESMRLLRASLPAGVELVTGFARDVPNVLADRSRIHQVVMNLCTNGWQAIPGGVGRITVSLSTVRVTEGEGPAGLRPGRYACLTVSDTGSGIDPAIVDRIFDPFFTTKAPGEGTGLGLSVVDGIVKSHDGTIAVETVPGQGATFRAYFPGVDAEVAARAVEPRPAPVGRGQRVLYLDDEVSLVNLTARLLGRSGYQVEGFTRPAEAIAAFTADPQRFDVVVSDMNMPTATGLSVAAEILRLRPDVPVALISGFVTDELAARADALGVRAVIYKPNLTRDLAPLISRLLS